MDPLMNLVGLILINLTNHYTLNIRDVNIINIRDVNTLKFNIRDFNISDVNILNIREVNFSHNYCQHSYVIIINNYDDIISPYQHHKYRYYSHRPSSTSVLPFFSLVLLTFSNARELDIK